MLPYADLLTCKAYIVYGDVEVLVTSSYQEEGKAKDRALRQL